MAYAGSGRTFFDDLTESYFIYFSPPEADTFCVIGFQLSGGRILRALLQVCPQTNIQVGDLSAIFGLPERTVMSPPRNLAYGSVIVNTEGWSPPRSPFAQSQLH